MKAERSSNIRESVKALDDRKLHELVVELKFSTKLEQATLAFALAERRRRARAKKSQAVG